jgi:Leucine-rich repeat (LRR) protein
LLEPVLLQLGVATAKAVARIWLRSETATDIADGLIDRLGARIPSLADRRRTARQFEDMADRVAQQLSPLLENEYQGIEDNELRAAVLGVKDLVDAIQSIRGEVLFEQDLEPVGLEAVLLQQPAARVRADLGDASQLVFDKLLRETCNYIIELAMSLPRFSATALVEVLRRETEIIDRVREVLVRMPQPQLAAADADAEFEVSYRRHIARELDRLELFGITLAEQSNRYDLSIAYITLAAATDESEAAAEVVTPSDGEESEPPHDIAEPEAYLRVDQALARGPRHLIRGEAGSGKTTLLQWLAVNASRRGFVGDLQQWTDSVPFFLQLRRYAGGELPSPEQFLEHTAKPIAGIMPTGWVHRQLASGAALLLVDGVDELPNGERTRAREWLLELLRTFPECRFVITTRPPAVPENWLVEADFSLAELLPMSFPDIISFVEHWYEAARRMVVPESNDDHKLRMYQRELTRVIRDTPSIRALATTPLLCAMLCALNRDRRTQLPRDRMELYRIALESLLDRRDVEREIRQHDEIALGVREKEILLQDVAYSLILNGKSDESKDAVVARIRDRLEFMSHIRADEYQVFNHLLTRSGLIREPVKGRIDYIHRTFQEYLGAARAVREGHISLLVQRSDDDQWREVIILAAGHANVAQRDELLLGLLARGDAEPWRRHRFHLLAVACLETAVELSPSTSEAVRTSLTEALPPSNMTEARAVASAGALAASLLAQYAASRANIAAACVRALCLIGGDSALSALRHYHRDARVTVIRELIRGWDYFDRQSYVDEVLTDSFLDYGLLRVSEVDALSSVHKLKHLRSLTFSPDHTLSDLRELPNAEFVSTLNLTGNPELASLDGIERFGNMRTLRLARNYEIDRLPELPSSLRLLAIEECFGLEDVGPLGRLPNLETLSLGHLPLVSDLTGLDRSRVTDLRLQGLFRLKSLDWLLGIAFLSRLRVAYAWQSPDAPSASWWRGQRDLRVLRSNRSLHAFELWPASFLQSLDGLPGSLLHLRLLDAQSLVDASTLSASSGMENLSINGASQLRDFDFLRVLDKLDTLVLERSNMFSDLSLITAKDSLTRLSVSYTAVDDISALADFTNLVFVYMAGCPIRSLAPLESAPGRLNVSLSRETADLLTPELLARHRFRVVSA